MTAAALVLAGVASLIHVYIFVMESLRWTEPKTRATFGVPTLEDAETMKSLAFNQGFYNLFLAIVTILGIVLYAAGQHAVGATLLLTGTGSMVLAGLVLLLSSPDKARAALIQFVTPAIAVVLMVISLLG